MRTEIESKILIRNWLKRLLIDLMVKIEFLDGIYPKNQMETITLTFGDCGENHIGMQKIGAMAEKGFSLEELKDFQKLFAIMGSTTEILDLFREDQKVYLLIVME